MFHWFRDHRRGEARKRPSSSMGSSLDRPLGLHEHAPDLYRVLSAYYRQDPAMRAERNYPLKELQ